MLNVVFSYIKFYVNKSFNLNSFNKNTGDVSTNKEN